ncbi:TKL/TKL-ccin protein kinase [Mycena leptocephala]|nr:TKL/TKL-ccin protein kinase [Mycena leptocephala]
MSNVMSSLIRIRDDESTDEDSERIEDDKSSSGGETSFEDPSLSDAHGRDLKGRVTQDDQYPFAGGGNSNIYRGKLSRSDGRKIRVAIKMFRMSDDGSGQMDEILRRLRREVDVWSRLKHPNILPFIGVCDDLAPSPVLISPFYKFGHVGTYLRKHPRINRADLVRGIAAGLEFLHANNIIHGDLKVQNVLVDKQGTPRICDFGISKIINRRGFTMSNVGTAPYMAPELFFVIDGATQEESPSTTKSSDVYSFALLVLEIFTSEPPKGRPSRPIVTSRILAGLRPKREDYDVNTVKNEAWSILDRCWDFEPQLRPSISHVLHDLNATFH